MGSALRYSKTDCRSVSRLPREDRYASRARALPPRREASAPAIHPKTGTMAPRRSASVPTSAGRYGCFTFPQPAAITALHKSAPLGYDGQRCHCSLLKRRNHGDRVCMSFGQRVADHANEDPFLRTLVLAEDSARSWREPFRALPHQESGLSFLP